MELVLKLSALVQHDWWFCQQANCNNPDRVYELEARLWGRLWLQQLKGDPFQMRTLRDLLANQISLPPSRVTDNTVVEQIAELLNSDRLHIHTRKMEMYAVGGPRAAEDPAAFPISTYRPKDSAAPPPVIEPPSFSPKADLSAQAAALVAAAAQGTPFCLE